ncbi:MAG TPA: DUF6364 family protein [Actinophytocola sp.]|jgi:predicted transcriptional regulator|uniref:DUF6364 family protein n=1 Tax=Actinophytocola sp. TaxID=1872138 RepID=UPI002DFB86A0|nr:DUF6364 family protein [Actinophytocola sp.]
MPKSVGLNKGTGGRKRNLTIQLDEEIIQQAKELAVRRNTSVSGLVTQKLEEMVSAEIRYRQAMERALEAMDNAIDRGGITSTRDELYEEMFDE